MTEQTYTLLIVEDSLADREYYRRVLKNASSDRYHLLESESVAAGLELCNTQSIDAILLDYLLPDDDGLTFLELLAAQSNGSSPPVVMMTGHGNESVAVRAMKLGAVDYLVKQDLTPALLESAVQTAIKKRRLPQQLPPNLDKFVAVGQTQIDMQRQTTHEQIMTIWESMTDAYVTLDRQWRVIYANRAATQLIGALTNLQPAAFLGKSHWELFPALAGRSIQQEYQRAIDDRVAVHLEIWYEPTDNWFETHAYPSAEGLGIYFRDITERKALETARAQSERDRDRFFELSIDMLAIANFDGYFVRLNPAWEKVLGYTPAALMAQPYLDFIHPDDLASTIAAASNLDAGEVVFSFENRYRCQDGSYRWLLWNAMPYVRGRLLYAIAHDITERKQAEALLQASERKFSAIFNQTFELLGIVSLDGVLIEVNQAALDSIAARASDLTGKFFWETPWWHTEQLQQQLREAIATAASGRFVRYQVEFPNPNGGMSITDFSLKPVFDEASRVVTLVAEARDITAQQVALRELQQAQAALEAQNQELDSFAHVVSHDLKAPLRAIANLSQWIEDDLEGIMSENTQQQMKLLRGRVHRMEATIGGLLDYARAGKTEVTIESVSVAQILAETIDSIAPPPTFKISIAPMPTFKTKRLLLSQVFANLIGNGIKHHDRLDGSIQISVRDDGDLYEFAIADDGPGIALADREQVFTIFQAANPQNRPDSSGIGLAIVKKIVEAEAGTIWLESEIDPRSVMPKARLRQRGTTFYFTWPKSE
jgi:PAS domain S-box-containing protein